MAFPTARPQQILPLGESAAVRSARVSPGPVGAVRRRNAQATVTPGPLPTIARLARAPEAAASFARLQRSVHVGERASRRRGPALARSRPRSAHVRFGFGFSLGFDQRPEAAFVVPPLRFGRRLKRLANLPFAARLYGARILVERRNARAPRQIEKVEEPARFARKMRNRVPMDDVDHGEPGRGPPMVHQAPIAAPVIGDVLNVRRPTRLQIEIPCVNRQAGVSNIPHAVDDLRIRQRRRHETEMPEI